MINNFNWSNNFSGYQIDYYCRFELNLNWIELTSLQFFEAVFLFKLLYLGYSNINLTSNFITILSNLDVIILTLYDKKLILLNSLYLDSIMNFSTKAIKLLFSCLWLTIDNTTIYFINAPEYFFFLQSFLNYQVILNELNIKFHYDSWSFKISSNFTDWIVYYIWLLLLLLLIIVSLNILRQIRLTTTQYSFIKKLNLLFWSFANEQRLNFDFVFIWFTYFFFIWIPVLMTYSDLNTELVEITHMFILFIFGLLIFKLLFNYSIHYFSFLENSVTEGFSVNFISKQFVRDIANSFALFLRSFLLVFRLNIYDGLDDFLDSYYVFFIDFDEDNYFDEILYSINLNFFTDNHEDAIFYNNTEYFWWFDLYSKYYTTLTKFLYFWIFILEEIFRVSLALYISYLIIFEIHSVNASYVETSFFINKLTGNR